MEFTLLQVDDITISEINSDGVILKNEQDAVDLLSEGVSDHVIVREQNVSADFFDLSTRVAGEILQKLSTYYTKLAIVGDFSKYPSKTLKDFIYECNKTKDHIFVQTKEEAIALWK